MWWFVGRLVLGSILWILLQVWLVMCICVVGVFGWFVFYGFFQLYFLFQGMFQVDFIFDVEGFLVLFVQFVVGVLGWGLGKES